MYHRSNQNVECVVYQIDQSSLKNKNESSKIKRKMKNNKNSHLGYKNLCICERRIELVQPQVHMTNCSLDRDIVDLLNMNGVDF